MVLSQLGIAYKNYVSRCFAERGWDRERVKKVPLEPALSTLGSLVEQHHIAACLHTPAGGVDVRRERLGRVARADGSIEMKGEPQEQLSVEALCDRDPGPHRMVADASWEWPRVRPTERRRNDDAGRRDRDATPSVMPQATLRSERGTGSTRSYPNV